MTDAVWVAMIVAVPTTIAPVLLRLTDSKARRSEKQQDYARQDAVAAQVRAAAEHAAEVAAQAARAADLLAEAQAETIKQADEVARLQASSTEALGGKLDMIHSFVNSDMTARMRTEIALMREIVGLRKEAGSKPSAEALAAISRLAAEIAERDRQQIIVDSAKREPDAS